MPTPASWYRRAADILLDERNKRYLGMTPDKLAWATVTPRKCRRHQWVTTQTVIDPSNTPIIETWCSRCHKPFDATGSRRGKLNRQRGNAIERDVAKQLGLRRVGHFGGAADAEGEPFVASVKSGNGYFSTRYWDQLKRMPVNGQQTAILVVTDAPGPGHKRRAYVVCELGDWIQLHGESGVGEAA